jgi:hypothetical protein
MSQGNRKQETKQAPGGKNQPQQPPQQQQAGGGGGALPQDRREDDQEQRPNEGNREERTPGRDPEGRSRQQQP